MASFTPIGKRSVSQEIINQIMESIDRGELRPGDRFPSERELCGMFEVGRSSVREAMVTLKAMGIVECRGKITVLSSDRKKLSTETLNELHKTFSNIKDVLEARKIMESEIVLLAVERATEEDLKTIEKQMRETDSIQTYAEMDQGFHMAIAAAAHNQVVYNIYKLVLDRLFSTHSLYEIKKTQDEKQIETIISEGQESHRALLEALESGNRKQAKAALTKHLNSAEARLFSSVC